LWQHEGASAPKVSFHDEHALEPNTQYEYCVSARNEFGEVFGPIVTIRTGKRLADARAAYETAAKPDDVAAVRAIWDRLAAGGHVRSLRSLDLLAAGLHAEGGPAYIPVRAADRADRSDLKVPGAVQRDTSGDRFTGTARLTAPEGLLPRQGPMTLLFALAWVEPPTDPRGAMMMHQGADDPVRDLDGSERANGRTLLPYDPAGRLRIDQEAFHRLNARQRRIAQPPDARTPAVCALIYDGRWLTWHTPASEPVILSSDVYFRNIESTPWLAGIFPAGAVGSFRLPWVAVWNCPLEADERTAVRASLASR
jgi:hypothetical protein